MTRLMHHLAQVNVARMVEPLDSPLLADFVAALEPVNALADASPGFVWRLQDEGGDATSIRAYDDDMIIVNMSVWGPSELAFGFKRPFPPPHGETAPTVDGAWLCPA